MTTKSHDDIREAVRTQYGSVARSTSESECVTGTGCCKPGASASLALGYTPSDLASVPDGANMGLGCGNPVAMAELRPGETVVDLGAGGGFDCFLAAQKVGESGRVIGVDMTPDMVSKARRNAEKAGAKNVEFRLGEIEHLPIADNTADVLLSNCVINLSPDKGAVYRDAYRVLAPGGRLRIADVVAIAPLPASLLEQVMSLTGCVAGAIGVEETKRVLKDAGFENIRVTVKEESRAFIQDWLPGSGAENFVVSAAIEAEKPKKQAKLETIACCSG